jgi:tRNA threonylcarbamoyladenosine biosynthesis protein TsaB
MAVLVLDGSSARCGAAVVAAGTLLGEAVSDTVRGAPALLPELVRRALQAANIPAARMTLVAVVLGPAGFTGLRSSVAFAHGLAAGWGVPLSGVSVGEALAEGLPCRPGRELWCAVAAHHGQVFLERDRRVRLFALSGLPLPDRPIALLGDAAGPVAERLAGSGADVVLVDRTVPRFQDIAAVAVRRAAAAEATAHPLYPDRPPASPPDAVRETIPG